METESDSLLNYDAGREWEEPPLLENPRGVRHRRTREQKKRGAFAVGISTDFLVHAHVRQPE